jgi:hypothetical protein
VPFVEGLGAEGVSFDDIHISGNDGASQLIENGLMAERPCVIDRLECA